MNAQMSYTIGSLKTPVDHSLALAALLAGKLVSSSLAMATFRTQGNFRVMPLDRAPSYMVRTANEALARLVPVDAQ